MLFQRINRSDPEKIFIVAKNSYSTASWSNGQALIWDFATDADGVGVTCPTSAVTQVQHNGFAVAGIAVDTVAAGAYGLLQVYGYHSAVRMRSWTGGAPAIAAGTLLTSLSAVFCLESYKAGATSTTTLLTPRWCAMALAAQASWTTKAVAAFIKAL